MESILGAIVVVLTSCPQLGEDEIGLTQKHVKANSKKIAF
jgi:hypothetical protein